MEKINAVKLTRLTVAGFKCFSDEQSFDLGDVTFITGGNHVGKTSLADAIAFAFCGRLYNGDATIDRLYNDGAKSLVVSLALLDGHGNSHELIRTRKNDKVSITWDGYNIRQKDLDVMFGECDVLLSILNPTYFIERLGNDGQSMLQKYLPLVPHEKVLEQLTPTQKTLLEKESLLSPETFIGNQRDRLRDYKDSLIALDGQEALLQKQRKDGKQDLALLEQRKNSISGQIEVLRKKREEGVNMQDLEKQLTDLLLRIDEATADAKQDKKKPGVSRMAQMDLNIRRAMTELEDTRHKQYESKYSGEMGKIQMELQLAREEYRRKEAAFQHVRAGVDCPTCCRPITEDALDATRAGIERGMKALVKQGVERNTQLSELRELDKKAREVFDNWKSEDLEKHETRISELTRQRDKILSEPDDGAAAITELLARRQELEESISLGGLTADEKLELDALEEELQSAARDYNSVKALCERPEPDIAGKRKELNDFILKTENMITAALDYLSERGKLTFQGLPLDKVGFSLYDVYKTTGEVKNTFRFTYEGRDYRKLSHSERVFAGMEVSELIKALTGRNYPVFVDDSESVVTLPKSPSGQVLLSRVMANVPLTVTVRDRQPVTQPATELRKAS